jgi:hypothetical protein
VHLFKKLFKAIGSVGGFLLRKLTGRRGGELEQCLIAQAGAEAQRLLMGYINKNPKTPSYGEMLAVALTMTVDISQYIGLDLSKVDKVVNEVINELDKTYNFQK